MTDLPIESAHAHALLLLAAGGALLFLGVLALWREARSPVRTAFLVLMLTGAGGLLPLAATAWTAKETVAVLWARAAFVCLPLVPAGAYGFTLAVLHLRERRRRSWRVLWALGAVFSSATLAGSDLVAGVTAYRWGYVPRLGELGLPFCAYAVGVLGLCMRHYWRQYRMPLRPHQKRRVVAFMAAFAAAHILLIDLFAAYGAEVYPFGYVGILLFALVATLAIWRHRLADPVLPVKPSADSPPALGADSSAPSGTVLPLLPIVAQREAAERRELGSREPAVSRLLFESHPLPSWVCDAQSLRIVEVNTEALLQYGYTREDFLALRLPDLHPREEEARLADTLLREDGLYDRSLPWRHRRHDGAVLEVEMLARAVERAGRRVFLVVSEDVTARRHAEQAVGEAEELLRQSDLRMRALFQAVNDAIIVADSDGGIVSWSQGAQAVFGYGAEEVLGESVATLLPEEDRESCRHHLALAQSAGGAAIPRRPLERTGRRKGGTLFPFEASVASWKTAEGTFFGAMVRDITRRKGAEQAMRESEQHHALAVRGADDGIWDWDLRTDEVYYSPRWKAILGWSEDLIGDRPSEWFDRIHPEDVERVRAEIAAHVKSASDRFRSEHRILHRDGQVRWVLSRGQALRDEQGSAYRLAGTLVDIHERRRVEENLARDSLYDRLTGLPNRALFADRLAHAIRRGHRAKDTLFAVLCVGVDHFKLVNDSLGHVKGDKLLVEIAVRLSSAVRPGDTTARLQGDVFTVLLDDTRDLGEATGIAQRIAHALASLRILDGSTASLSASIGIALSDRGYESADDALRDAEIAMYRAKALGRARCAVFDPTMHSRAAEALSRESALRRALDEDELLIHYQPIVRLQSGQVAGFEALLRWAHPEHGLVPPREFIPLAEATGLITDVGRFVLRESCRQLRAWHDEFPDQPLTVSVNVSPRQLSRPELLQDVEAILIETGLDPRALVLEVTESAIIENPEAADAIFSQLTALGVRLALDDFGAGHSSFASLDRFPFHSLKIDRSFVAPLVEDDRKAEIVRSLATLGMNLGMELVAEGVETAEQRSVLAGMNCHYGQGFFFSRPVDARAARALLREAYFPARIGIEERF